MCENCAAKPTTAKQSTLGGTIINALIFIMLLVGFLTSLKFLINLGTDYYYEQSDQVPAEYQPQVEELRRKYDNGSNRLRIVVDLPKRKIDYKLWSGTLCEIIQEFGSVQTSCRTSERITSETPTATVITYGVDVFKEHVLSK